MAVRKSRQLTETPKVEIHIKEDPRPSVIHQMASEPALVKEPSDDQKVMEEARRKKRYATEAWIAGRITTADHSAVHARANHVLMHKPVVKFKGKSGEHKQKRGGGVYI